MPDRDKAITDIIENLVDNACVKAELKRLLVELQVQREELRTQNEELRRQRDELAGMHADLDAARRKYFDLYDLAPIGYLTFDARGLLLEINQAGAALLRTEPRLIKHQPILSYIDRADRSRFLEHLSAVGPNGHQTCELQLVRKDGSAAFVQVESKTAGREPGDHHILSAFIDITDRKMVEHSLRESEARFRTMADGLPLMVWVHDAEGRQRFVNQTFLEYFGVTTEEMTGGRWQLLMHPDDAPAYADGFMACVRDRRPFHAQVRVRRADGEWSWIESWGRPRMSPDGVYLGYIGTSADISERKRVEQVLCDLTDTLEQQVAERTRLADSRSKQLQGLAVELIEAEEQERRRIAQLLHDDLQQMMASAKLQLQAACANLPDNPLLRNVDHLLSESLAKTRSLSHELSPAVLHHSGLLVALEWLAGQMKEQFGMAVELKPDLNERFDSAPLNVFLFRSVQELLFNIIKHAGVQKAHVFLSDADGVLVIRVSDHGKGFDPEAVTRSSEKAGFGLLTIQERANHIGGAFNIESRPGEGSCFTLTVPLRLENSDHRPQIDPVPESRSRKAPLPKKDRERAELRVLFADDHKVMRQGLIQLIAGQPDIHVVGEASNGREVLELARRVQPDVVVTDVYMPEMDGIDATRRIKAELPHVRVIALSMHNDDHLVRTLRQAGADALVSKTASSAELLKAIYGIAPQKE